MYYYYDEEDNEDTSSATIWFHSEQSIYDSLSKSRIAFHIFSISD